MSNEGEDMPVVLEKARLNLWNLIGFCVGIAVTSFGWGVTYMKMDNAITSVRAETAAVKVETKTTKDEFARAFVNIETKLAPMTTLQFQAARALEQVAEQKAANEETNKRIDRVVDSLNNKLDAINVSVNTLITRVEVMNSIANDRQRNARPVSPTQGN